MRDFSNILKQSIIGARSQSARTHLEKQLQVLEVATIDEVIFMSGVLCMLWFS